MKSFDYVRPQSAAEAAAEMGDGAVYMASGSDLLGALKADILPRYPKKAVSLKDIKGMKGIRREGGCLVVGAMTTLTELQENELVKSELPILAQAAHSVATPLIRNIGTVGGNLCQDVRCWFYRYPHEIGGRLDCARKGGRECYGIHGDNRYHSVERALGDYILEHIGRFYRAPERESGKKAAIVGGGPAGLAAAFYLRRYGHAVTVYERMEEVGGVLMYGIPEYRLPKHYVRAVASALAEMGIRFVTNTCVGRDIAVEEIERMHDTVFLDTGAWKQPILGIDGENLTQFGLNFLVEVKKFMTKQIGKNVLVCGGGNVAMDVALTAVRLGAEKVTLVCLEQRHEMSATEEEVQRALEEGVVLVNGRGLSRVIYDGGRVKGLETKACTSVRDASGRFNPQYDENDLSFIEAGSIILATGQRVDLDFLGEKFKNEIQSARGLIEVGEENDTRRPGVYAGGDAATGPSVAIKAIRAGAAAARSMSAYMGHPMPAARRSSEWLRCDPSGVVRTRGRVEADTPIAERCLDEEDSSSLSMAEAAEEAKRCMNCGCYSVNASDLSPVLVALNAEICTSRKSISAAGLFTSRLKVKDMLEPDEIITEIRIPLEPGRVTSYDKFRLRDSVDFAMVSLASVYTVEEGRIKKAELVLGGVAPVPLVRQKAADFLAGRAPDEETAEKAAELALEGAVPFSKNAYKVNIAAALVKRSVLRLAQA